ncbi:hypothetical protein FKP32DRAFT_1567789, partial [Trametes sanguinea]
SSDKSDSSSDSDSDSDSSSSSDDDSDDEKTAKTTKTKTVEVKKTPSEAPSQSASSTPKRNGNGKEKNGKKPRKSNTPFQRIKPEEVKFADERLKDNRFEARVRASAQKLCAVRLSSHHGIVQGASQSDYGAKAARDLIVTRGAGFRKEKNKKKRGSYRGGEITMESYSIKFND